MIVSNIKKNIYFLVLCLGFYQCGEKSEDAEELTEDTYVGSTSGIGGSSGGEIDNLNEMPAIGSLLIEVPSSMTGGDSASLRAALTEEEEGGEGGFFMMPIQMLKLGHDIGHSIGEIADHLFGKPECREGGESEGEAECEEFRGIVKGQITDTLQYINIEELAGDDDDDNPPDALEYCGNCKDSDFDYVFSMLWKDGDGIYQEGARLEVSPASDESAEGQLTFFSAIAGEDDDEGGPSTLQVYFDSRSTKKVMNITGYDFAEEEDNEMPIEKLYVGLTKDGDIVTSSGVLIRGELEEDAGTLAPFETAEKFAFVFKMAGEESGDANVAIQSLAIPSESQFGDDDLFDTYDIGSIMLSGMVSAFRNPDSEDFDCAGGGTVLGSDVANICSTNTSVTDDEVGTLLTNICSGDNASNFGGLCSAIAMGNPAYLTKDDGLVGMGSDYDASSDFDNVIEAHEDIDDPDPEAVDALEVPEPQDGLESI